MRHLLLTEEWHPRIGGSIQLFDEIYCRRFPPEEFVHVVAGMASGWSGVDTSFVRPVTRFDPTRYPWLRPESLLLYLRMSATALRVALRERTDVVHCARVIPEGIVGLFLARTLGIPYVVWVHGEEVSMYERYPGKRALMPKVFAGARAVLCNSTYSSERARVAGAPVQKLHVIHPGVDASRFEGPFETEDLRARFGLHGKKVVLSVGRLTQRKGHDQVLRALARLDRRDVAYLLVSDGEYEPELRRLTYALHLNDRVHFVGSVPAHELPRYYALADVFIMANRALSSGDVEGFGIVFLEASAAGLPVIGGRSGGVPDAVRDGETGLLVDGDSVDQIADALRTLLDHPSLRQRMGARGRAWVRQHFSWDRAAQRVRDLSVEAREEPQPLAHQPTSERSSCSSHHAYALQVGSTTA